MKSCAFLILASFGSVLIAEIAVAECQDGWEKHDDNCYLRETSKKPWEKAEKMCEANGASLVTVNDQAEMDFLNTLMGKNGGWNGLNNRADIDALEWSSGESSEYRYWKSNEPKKNNKTRCVRMVSVEGYKWRMEKCSRKLRFICEKAAPLKVPDPVALFPLNGTYGTKEINGRQPDGIPSDVKLAPGPDGRQNGSYEFNGQLGSRIEFPNDGGLEMKHSFTLLCWAQPFKSGYSNSAPMIAYYDRNTYEMGVVIGFGNAMLISYLADSSLIAPNTTTLAAMTWHYVGVSYNNATGNATLYLDGVVVATNQFPKDAAFVTQYSLIGGSFSERLTSYEGRIAWLQLYDVALSAEQVKAIEHFTGQSEATE